MYIKHLKDEEDISTFNNLKTQLAEELGIKNLSSYVNMHSSGGAISFFNEKTSKKVLIYDENIVVGMLEYDFTVTESDYELHIHFGYLIPEFRGETINYELINMLEYLGYTI